MVFWLVICLILRQFAQVFNAYPSSFTVVIYSSPRTSGPSLSPALCTLLLLVCLGSRKPAAVLWANAIDIAMSIVLLTSHACGWKNIDLILPHLSISVLLNVLLTLMIVIRLILHDRSVRAAIGSPTGMSRLYKTIVTMLIESSALYAVNSLVLIGLWAAGSPASGIFLPLISPTQVSFSHNCNLQTG